MPNHEPRNAIAVYGATGYTGRRVAQALHRRGHHVLLSGRDHAALTQLAQELGSGAEAWPARLDEPGRLRALGARARAVIHCAGPFDRTCEPVVQAAIDAGAHYLDVSGEQRSNRFVFESADGAARGRVALLPGFAFFSALGDLLVARLAEEVGRLDEVTIAYAVADWEPSDATLEARLLGIAQPWVEYTGGVRPVQRRPTTEWFDFPGTLGRRRVIRYPTSEAFTVPRHVDTQRVRTLLTASTLMPRPFEALLPDVTGLMARVARGPGRAALRAVLARLWRANRPGAMHSDPSTFTVSVRLQGPAGVRTGHAQGRGIYDLTVPMVVFGAERVLSPDFALTGALAPAQAVPASLLLDHLAAHGLRYELPPGVAARVDAGSPQGAIYSTIADARPIFV